MTTAETRVQGKPLSSSYSVRFYFSYSPLRDRYPEDPYDRIWFRGANQSGWTTVSTDKDINTVGNNGVSSVPQAVLKTAVVSEGLSFRVTVGSNERHYLFMYFAELEQLGSNETREFNVHADGQLWYGPFRPRYLVGGNLYTARSGTNTTYLYTLDSTSNSTRPPMINAREVYGLKQLESSPTDFGDSESPSLTDILLLSFHFTGICADNQGSFM